MLRSRHPLVLAVLVACALLTGCGSSSSSGSGPATSAAQSRPAGGTSGATSTPDADVSGPLKTLPEAPTSGELPPPPTSVGEESERAYLRAVFDDAQRFWQQEFSTAGVAYAPARLTLFSGSVHSGCGAQADVGPFYCSANHGVYLDLGFFQALARHAGVGPFARAYVVGHEFGHHVQFQLGIMHRVAALNQQDPAGENARSVRVELQADCLAGVWAHSRQARGKLTDEDLNDALRTAALIGDDFQQQASGRVVDSALWTHGSSRQRQHWLVTGVRSGSPSSCDTFSGGP
jgi:predicted metalloprotease